MNTERMNAETLQAALADYFAPWVQALHLTVESLEADRVTLRLPHNDQLSRVGGMLRAGKSLVFGEIDIRGANDGKSVCRVTTTYALL